MIHHETLSKEAFCSEFNTDTYSDYLSYISTNVLENVSSSEYNYDSNNVNISATNRQNILVTDSDMERENEIIVLEKTLQVCQV